jgi:hypothetical protein
MTDLSPPATNPPVRLSPVARTLRIFVRPADAWEDLQSRAQWWFPLLLALVIWLALQAFSFDRVMIPMLQDQWAERVANGQMEAAQQAQLEHFFTTSPAARWLILGQQAVVWPVMMLFQALVVWFGTGFVLGTRMKFRYAFEVICWSGLVKIPQLLLFTLLALQRQTYVGVHLGLGVLVPEPETPSKLLTGVASFLDLIGPFEAWWIAVAVLGCAALAGAPRRSVAWVLVALYLALGAFFAAVGAFFGPGS